MEFPNLSRHGGSRGVTGSCHPLHLDACISLLIDCGLERGADAPPGAESAPIGSAIAGMHALIITHVHPDHVGRIPELLAGGYRAPILYSEPSARLLPLVLVNCLKAMLGDPWHEVMFVGYQAKGKPGAVVQAGPGVRVDLDGPMYEVRANPPRSVSLVHDERCGKAAVAAALEVDMAIWQCGRISSFRLETHC